MKIGKLENLISNAIKYSDQSKDRPSISITYTRNDKDVTFSVEDNGIGIPKEHQSKMFGMFNRFHPKVAFGSGLGMYLMKKSAKTIGAALSYEDTGSGSKFTLTFHK